MRALGLWSLLATAAVIGCGLSPGHDLPSARSNDGSGDGDPVTSPGGDGDIGIVIPPGDIEDACATGGGGLGSGGLGSAGMAGAEAGGTGTGGAEAGDACGGTASDS